MIDRSTLTAEEKEILTAYESDEFKSVDSPGLRAAHLGAANQTFKKDKRVNIRISGQDLELLQERALRDGVPYQTLMSSVLHKYVNGGLIDRDR